MNYKIYPFLFCLLVITACNSNQNEGTNIQVEAPEQDKSTSLDVLLKNEKVKVGAIQKRNIARTIPCTGQIDIPPTGISSVHSKINGQITYLKYLPGDYVKKGTLLTSVEQPQLVKKQRILLETKANLDFARKDYERKKILKAGQATPEKTFDASQNKFELLQATYKGLKKELELLGIDVNTLEKENKFQTAINIYAPQSGFIHEVLVNKGEMISPTTRLMDIANVNDLHLELQVLSKNIGAISKGQQIKFTIPNRSETFSAKVIKINPMLESESATLMVHCQIEHPDKQTFVAGMFVNATIEAESVAVEGLPLQAVIKEGEDYYAFQVQNNQVQKTALINPSASKDFIVFENTKTGQWITEGAYYVE